MRFFRRVSFMVGLFVFWITIAAIAGLGYWRSTQFVKPEVSQVGVQLLLNEFRASHVAANELDITPEWRAFFQTELARPEGILPSPSRYNAGQLAAILKYGETCAAAPPPKIKDANLGKLVQWFDFKCGRTGELPETLWKKPPLIHPLGGSWAYWLHRQGAAPLKSLSLHKQYLHALERKSLPPSELSPVEKIFADLTPADLARFTGGAQFMETDNYVIVSAFSSGEFDRLQAFAKADWKKYLSSAVIQPFPAGSKPCDFQWSQACWNVREDLRAPKDAQYIYLLFASLLGLAATLLATLWLRASNEREMERNQQLVMQTLTHELRHPVAGLRLAAEALRASYDTLPDEIKDECLRLLALSERMGRLVSMSHQYLRLLSEDHQFVFRTMHFESTNNFLQAVFEPYEGKVNFIASGEDSGCTVDGYWLSTCLTNLATNALTHGRPPIDISWQRHGTDLSITVQDAGDGPSLSLKQLIEPRIKHSSQGGMGLGISLIHRLVSLMNGRLTLNIRPTRFTITLKGGCREAAVG